MNTNNTIHGLTYTIYDLAQIMAQTVQIIITSFRAIDNEGTQRSKININYISSLF